MTQAPQNPPPDAAAADHRTRQVELLISTLLRVGVIASLLIILAGTVVTFIHHRAYLHSPQDLPRLTKPTNPTQFPHTFAAMIQGLRHGEGRSIVILGLLLLIATPVMRVAVSIFAFVYEKDATFVLITSVVLALLLLSFFLGQAGG